MKSTNEKSSGQPATANEGHGFGPHSSAHGVQSESIKNAPLNVGSTVSNLVDYYKVSLKSKSNPLKITFNKIASLVKFKILIKDCLSSTSSHSDTCIVKCGHRRCLTCPVFSCDSNFKSSVTGKKYKAFNPNILLPLSCKSKNIIYLITCRQCSYQYVGQTTQEFSKRLCGHRASISLGSRFIGQHFSSDGHSHKDMKVNIIEKIIPIQGEKNSQFTKRLLEREDFWIRELCTVWPYGLNDNVKGVGNISSKYSDLSNTMSLFNTNTRSKRSHGHRKGYSSSNHQHVTFKYLTDLMSLADGLHRVRSVLYCVPLSFLKELADKAFTEMRQSRIDEHLYLIVSDIEHHRLYKPVSVHSTEQRRYFLKILFDNKGIDLVNLPGIFNDPKVSSAIPIYFKNQSSPCISYKYSNTISSKIFNHNKAVEDFCVDSLGDGSSCNCSSSKFKYDHSGHIITGDLSIITNSKLRDLISKGPKYREPRKVLWDKNKEIIFNAVDSYAKSWAKRENASVSVLDDWIRMVRHLVNERIHKYKYFRQDTRPVLSDPSVVEYLNALHKDFVLAPADKASNNVIIICKKYYHLVLANELGINQHGGSTGNDTYTKCAKSEKDIVSKHLSFLLNYKIIPESKSHCLPSMYWLPKLHKNPYKSRFIAASSRCTTKTLSVLLTKGLEKVQQYMTNRSSIILKTSGINNMWILKNSQSLLQSISSSHIDKYDSITTWDFSTLYTTIPHSDLIKRISGLINLTFDKNDGKKLLINERNAYFSDEDRTNYSSFSKKEFCKLFEFLMSNIYIKLGDEIFRQIIGIPMGTNCAPLLANLYLFSYEYDFMMKLLKKKKLHLARKFNFTFRYIDDLISLNNSYFKDYIKEIYPKELELKETTESKDGCSYLDLFIFRSDNDRLRCKLYDKRDDFSFKIINYPFMESNIPSRPAYGVYVSRLVAFARACSSLSDFVFRHDLLAKKLLSQGYKISLLRKTFSKFNENHSELVSKYNIKLSDFLKNHLSDVFLA